MRLLYVVSGQSFFSSDPGRKRLAMVRCWENMGHEVRLLCGGDVLGPNRRRKIQNVDSSPSYLPWYRRRTSFAPLVNSASEILNIQHDIRLSKAVAQQIKTFRPHIYWQRSARLDGHTFATARASGLPCVLEWKDHLLSLYGLSLLKPWAAWVEWRKELTADYIVTESELLRQQLLRRRRRDPRSVLVAYNAVDPDDFTDKRQLRPAVTTREQWSIPDESFVVAYAGTFNTWYHKVEMLVKGLQHVPNGLRENIHVLLIGDGEGRPLVEGLAREYGLEPQIHITGMVPYDEVPHLLAAADAAALPGCTDIIVPIKVFEYMAMALPTLLPDYPVCREIVTDGETAALFEPDDPQGLADAMAALASDRESARRIGQQAREHALEHFTWEKTWGAVLETIYEDEKFRDLGR